MSKTLLQGINELLKDVKVLDSGGSLGSLTDTARQTFIDTAIQAFNETLDQLYDLPATPQMPNIVTSATVTLGAGDQDYALASDLIRLLPDFGLVDRTNNHIIEIDTRPDAFRRLTLSDLEQDDTGLPSVAAIRPTDGLLWLDRAPSSSEAGRIYTYFYEKDGSLSVAADTFPFNDAVFRAVVPAAGEVWKQKNNRDADEGIFRMRLAQAASRLSQLPRKRSWDNESGVNLTDPFVSS